MASSSITVAIFLSNFDVGGTERQMIQLIRRLDRERFDVRVICFTRAGQWLPQVEETGVPIVEFPISGFRRLRTWQQARAFSRWCRDARVAVLQTCDFYTNVFGLPSAALAGVPVRIASRRDVNPGRGFAKTVLQRAAYAAADVVVANSRAAAARLEHEHVTRRRIHVISNGLDVSRYPRGRAPRAVRRIITVARLRPEKAHEVLLEAAALVVARHPEVEFDIVGDGSRLSALARLAERLGIASHVHFLGHRDDVVGALEAADLFVLPSRSEAFPNGVLEAMAAGLPVVACAVGGLPELVNEGKTGLLVPPEDPQALAAATSSLIDDPQRAWTLGQAGRELVEAHYSFDKMTRSFEQLYASLTAATGRPLHSSPRHLPESHATVARGAR